MLHAALALAVLTGPQAPPPPLALPRFASACAETIDPTFVRNVAPPVRDGRNPLLWWISGPKSAPSTQADCLRPLQVKNGR
jgi:hypothetical protein